MNISEKKSAPAPHLEV